MGVVGGWLRWWRLVVANLCLIAGILAICENTAKGATKNDRFNRTRTSFNSQTKYDVDELTLGRGHIRR